jgi:hypothetical protein
LVYIREITKLLITSLFLNANRKIDYYFLLVRNKQPHAICCCVSVPGLQAHANCCHFFRLIRVRSASNISVLHQMSRMLCWANNNKTSGNNQCPTPMFALTFRIISRSNQFLDSTLQKLTGPFRSFQTWGNIKRMVTFSQ